jgi:tetratricopeptide (TPR) repeat protein
MSHRRFAILALACLLAAAVPAAAQSWAGKGRLQGVVTDQQGNPIAGAKVTLKSPKDPEAGPPPLTTDKAGKWSILGLTGGQWTIAIEAEGFVGAEGPAHVNEFAPAPAIRVKLNPITKEMRQEAKGNEAVTLVEKGNALLLEEKYAEARAQYEQALGHLEPKDQPAVLRGIARTWYQEKQHDKAIETLKQALAIAPDDVESLRLIVTLLAARGKEEEARAYMAKLPAGATVDPNTLLNVGIKLYNDGKYAEAIAEFDRVVRENPTLPDAYYYRGLAYLAAGKSAEAKADLQKLLELDSNHAKAAEAREFLKQL